MSYAHDKEFKNKIVNFYSLILKGFITLENNDMWLYYQNFGSIYFNIDKSLSHPIIGNVKDYYLID